MTLVLPPQFSRRILFVAQFIWLSIITAITYELYFCALVCFTVWVTSINYWSHPTKGIRRTIDIICASLGFLYHLVLAYGSLYQVQYYMVVLTGFSLYYLARQSNDQNCSSMFHCGLHICGNISNIILYLGYKK